MLASECACGCGEAVLTPGRRFRRGHNNRTSEGRARLSADRAGAGNPAWKGDDAGYFSLHEWLNKEHPKAGVCEECGAALRTEYAFLRHPHPHTRRREDYRELCCTCHGSLDGRSDFARQRAHGADGRFV